jgi:hypothetical protein
MWHVEGRKEKHTGFWWQWCLKEDTSSIPGTDGRVTSKWVLKKYNGRLLSGLIWLRVGTYISLL